MNTLRVAAYCRVSTDDEDQLNSLENQKQYFNDYINSKSDWKLYKVFYDKGITGTSTKRRKYFNQMIEDAEAKKYDLILTKEVSRFARNTVDTLQYVRRLKSLGVGVLFTNDNIDTRDNDGELRLTIMASIAQEESRKTSSRVRWGLRQTMKSGTALGNHTFGFFLENGQLTINEEEAKVVREIYNLYLSGLGTYKIGKILEERAIKSPKGLNKWKNVSILRILQNERNVGDLKQQKEITIDFLEHKKIVNDGREEFIYIKNHHEGIISREIFEETQKEIERRKKMTDDKSKYSNRYPFSGKIVCSECGAKYTRRYWNGKHEQKNAVWQCSNNARWGTKKINSYGDECGCNSRGIHETILQDAFNSALTALIIDKDNIRLEVNNAIKAALSGLEDSSQETANINTEINKIKRRKTRLLELYTDEEISKEDFISTNEEYQEKVSKLNNQLLNLNKKNEQRTNLEDRLKSINKLVDKIINLDTFSDCVCWECLDKVVAYSREKICFFLKSNDNTCLSIPITIPPQGLPGRPALPVSKEFRVQPVLRVPLAPPVPRVQPGPPESFPTMWPRPLLITERSSKTRL